MNIEKLRSAVRAYDRVYDQTWPKTPEEQNAHLDKLHAARCTVIGVARALVYATPTEKKEPLT